MNAKFLLNASVGCSLLFGHCFAQYPHTLNEVAIAPAKTFVDITLQIAKAPFALMSKALGDNVDVLALQDTWKLIRKFETIQVGTHFLIYKSLKVNSALHSFQDMPQKPKIETITGETYLFFNGYKTLGNQIAESIIPVKILAAIDRSTLADLAGLMNERLEETLLYLESHMFEHSVGDYSPITEYMELIRLDIEAISKRPTNMNQHASLLINVYMLRQSLFRLTRAYTLSVEGIQAVNLSLEKTRELLVFMTTLQTFIKPAYVQGLSIKLYTLYASLIEVTRHHFVPKNLLANSSLILAKPYQPSYYIHLPSKDYFEQHVVPSLNVLYESVKTEIMLEPFRGFNLMENLIWSSNSNISSAIHQIFYEGSLVVDRMINELNNFMSQIRTGVFKKTPSTTPLLQVSVTRLAEVNQNIQSISELGTRIFELIIPSSTGYGYVPHRSDSIFPFELKMS